MARARNKQAGRDDGPKDKPGAIPAHDPSPRRLLREEGRHEGFGVEGQQVGDLLADADEADGHA